MEEYVALDSSKQKQFIKSIKGIKQHLIKDKRTSKTKKEVKEGVKIGKVKKPKKKPRGLVYLSHIPHGFYEHEMTQYFKQFGAVTNARVIRSKRTGMSKGHAFVEFKDPNVAEIVAETMNNYLMGKRLIKAEVIPHDKQRRNAQRKNWNPQNNPGNDSRQKMKKMHNSIKNEHEEIKNAKRLLLNLSKTKQKLKKLDIDYDFFTPVDIPESLLSMVVNKQEDATSTVVKKKEQSKVKVEEEKAVVGTNKKHKIKKDGSEEIKDEDVKSVLHAKVQNNKKSKKLKESKSTESNTDNKVDIKIPELEKGATKTKVEGKQTGKALKGKNNIKSKEKKQNDVQVEKEKKLMGAGVKPPGYFIRLQQKSSDESDSSMAFDSDEYEKMMEQSDSDVQSDDSDEINEDINDNISTDEDESSKVKEKASTPQKKRKGPLMEKLPVKEAKKQNSKPNINKPSPKQMKIMPPRRASTSAKMPKFEKKVKKPFNNVNKKNKNKKDK